MKITSTRTLTQAPSATSPAAQLTRFRKLRQIAAKKRQLQQSLGTVAGSATTGKAVPLTVPGPDPSNKQAVKYYVFNQTGNIMMSSTDLSSDTIQQSVRDVFNEVSVFFAAMTKAISTTINPATTKPYSIYDYNALMSIIGGSGLFVHVTEEDLTYNTSSYGADFSAELIQGLIGLATGSGELAFAEAMISSMGSAGLDISSQNSSSDSKVANIIFVCEYLLGMPVVSAIVVYCDMTENITQVQAGPCYSETSISTNWTMHKDTYMFVTPKFIDQYAGDLLSIESDATYIEFVNYLSELVLAKPVVTSIVNSATNVPASGSLTASAGYTVIGADFGAVAGQLWLGGKNGTQLTGVGWGSDAITFTAPATANTTAAAVEVFIAGNTSDTPDAASSGTFTVVAS